ncbi:hypothetical protein SIXOD_v1c19030 [Spiroplasma ixodetis Y32]|nr:hypothetical protein SIXOD_v1c19030 [Spiroplasma ixodetis Y32]
MFGVYSSKDEIKSKSQRCLWLVKKMVPWRILNVWWHFKHLILLKLEVFKLVQEHMIHLFFLKLAIYFKQSCSVWKALLNSFNFIVSSTSTCGEKSDKFFYITIINMFNY